MNNISSEIQKTIENLENLEFGINFKVWEFTRNQQDGIICSMFLSLNLVSDFHVLLPFINDLRLGYLDNPYHSFNHAIDVTYIIYNLGVKNDIFNSLNFNLVEIAALLIASLAHDILHPGKNNLFLINSNHNIAKKYNNKSVLEHHSISHLHDLIQKHNLLDLFAFKEYPDLFDNQGNKLSSKDYMISIMDDAILNTDMCYHFNLLNHLTRRNSTSSLEVDFGDVELIDTRTSVSSLDQEFIESLNIPLHIQSRKDMINILL